MSETSPRWTDRYKALGIPYPDVETMCKGQCEGIGVYPQFYSLGPPEDGEVRPAEERPITTAELMAWRAAHDGPHSSPCDGWHFIQCADCNGTGKRR